MVNQSQFIEMFGDLSTNSTNINITTIDELFDVGSSKRVFEKDWTTSGVPFYRAREIVKLAKDGFVDNELFITESMYSEYAEKYGIPAPGDIMVTGVGTLGVCYLVKEGDRFYYKDGNTLCFHSLGKIDSRFVVECYKMPFVINQIEGRADFTTVGTYTIEKARKTRIPWPSKEQQKKFLSVVYQADKSKFAGFKSQFIEMFGRTTNSKFPVQKLSEVCSFKSGTTFSPEVELQDGDYMYAKVADMNLSGNETYIIRSTKYVNSDIAKSTWLPKGSVVFPKRGAAIHTNKKRILSQNTCVDLNTIGVIPGKDINTLFLYWFFKCLNLSEICEDSGIPQINNKNLIPLDIVVPPMPEQIKFSIVAKQADKSKYLN